MDFILKVLEDYQDDGSLDETLTRKRNEVFDEQFKKINLLHNCYRQRDI